MNQVERITIGIINYNGENTIRDTLDSVYRLDYPDYRVLIVDNGSSDGSLELIKKYYPACKLIELNMNIGPAEARNICIKNSQTKWVFLLDNDIVVSEDCLGHLVKIALTNPQIVALHPQMMDRDNPDMPQLYNGGYIHYICAFIPRNGYPKSPPQYEIFPTVSSGALLVNCEVATKIGLFDGDYFFNWEDGDFTIRLTGAGFQCANVPGAKVYHIIKHRGKSKVFYQVRNRWYFILKIYNIKTIISIIPALILYEISQTVLLILKGSFKDYTKASLAVIRNLPRILKKRAEFHKLKKLKDSQLLTTGELYIPPAFRGGKIFNLLKNIYVNIFNSYWKFVLKGVLYAKPYRT